MNLCSFIVKIISIPEQTFLSGTISVVKMQVQFGRVKKRKKKKSFDRFEVFIWGKAGNNLMKYYTAGDYIIIEGSLRFKKVEKKSRMQKHTKFVVKKFYPFLLGEDEVSK